METQSKHLTEGACGELQGQDVYPGPASKRKAEALQLAFKLNAKEIIQDLEPTGQRSQLKWPSRLMPDGWVTSGLWRLLGQKPVRSIPFEEQSRWQIMPTCDALLYSPPDACG